MKQMPHNHCLHPTAFVAGAPQAAAEANRSVEERIAMKQRIRLVVSESLVLTGKCPTS